MSGKPACLRRTHFRPEVGVLEQKDLLAAGALDASFGTNGRLLLDPLRAGDEQAVAVAVQNDGKIVTAGFAEDHPETSPAVKPRVSRMLPGGTPDATFGSGGSVVLDVLVPDITKIINDTVALALQPDGKVLVASTTPRGGGYDFVVARLTPEGALDRTFGDRGVATVDFSVPGSDSDDRFRALALDGQGRIVLAGIAVVQGPSGADDHIAVARLTPDGALDTSFGDGGRFTAPGNAGITAVALQGDRVVLAGWLGDNFLAVRLTAAGRLDDRFGTGGWQTGRFDSPTRGSAAHAVAVQAWDGKILLAGVTDVGGGGSDFGVARLDPDGALDPTFDDDGRVIFHFGNDFTEDRCAAVALQGDRKIVVTGFHQLRPNESEFAFAAARLTPDGRLDTAFGDGGKQSFTFPHPGDPGGQNDDKPYGLALQRDGKLVLAGHSMNANGEMKMALARLEGDALPPPPTVIGMHGPLFGRPRLPMTFRRLLSDPGAADPFGYFWMVTLGSGRKRRVVGVGAGAAFTFLPRDPGSYAVTLYAGSGTTHTFTVRV